MALVTSPKYLMLVVAATVVVVVARVVAVVACVELLAVVSSSPQAAATSANAAARLAITSQRGRRLIPIPPASPLFDEGPKGGTNTTLPLS